jgi:hypothetical protein
MKSDTFESFGKFVGSVKAEWLSDGRRMKLLTDFIYIDPKDLEWIAPLDSIVDGASIPQFAWSIIGGPFEGKYRNASVIHDVACDLKLRDWESVHEAFYHAMRASEVDSVQALVMYAAVYHFGPRWSVKINELIPQSQVKSRLGEIQYRSAPGSRVVMEEEATNAVPEDTQDRPYSHISIEVTPPQESLQQSDFSQLELDIREQTLSLEEIRNYRHPHK